MTDPTVLGFAYMAFGYAVMLCVCRRLNGKLSIADLVVCSVAALGWPLILLFLGIGALVLRPSRFTEKRW